LGFYHGIAHRKRITPMALTSSLHT